MFEIIVKKEGLTFLGWRDVPTTPDVLGKKAVDVMPYIVQGFVAKPANVKKGLDFDRKLYVVRRVFEQSNEDTYVVSLSSRTIVYKGMFLVSELRLFFADLQDKDYESAIAIVHSRFSTNTNPSWMRASSLPFYRSQRRDQHHPRQRRHDARARGNHRFQLFKGRYDEGSAHRQPGRLRLCPAG